MIKWSKIYQECIKYQWITIMDEVEKMCLHNHNYSEPRQKIESDLPQHQTKYQTQYFFYFKLNLTNL